eukprot:CAMPEP_0194410530 /NCGR_PEP_ID=MMETSP0176-20130528/8597_1 /TAXON_ID=216777 /ORGANISM="Proboscia alata, Strain PI-D3" /LENGTH=469 /DNA_ID=CAMNT_0039211937 /DNA_START=189 /DNA_END=1598 /DNA_ORIENTATION=+
MSYIQTPVNQVRLTNVAVVRITRHGKRFEVACYRNKVVNYRQGIETDLSEVLQTERIFSNVGKGTMAKTSDLQTAFGTNDTEEICKRILEKGDLQVSDGERSVQQETTTREIATMIQAKCIDPRSRRPHTLPSIRDAMSQAGFVVHPSKSRTIKGQMLECVKAIQKQGCLPLERAKMKLCAYVEAGASERVGMELRRVGCLELKELEGEGDGDAQTQTRIEFLMDPGLYRRVDEIVKFGGVDDDTGIGNQAGGVCGRLEILRQCVYEEGEVELESELRRKENLINEVNVNSECKENSQTGDQGSSSAPSETNVNVVLLPDNDQDASPINPEPDTPPQLQLTSKQVKQNHKKAAKKSKKAKRREKEEAAEREAKLQAENNRQTERLTRLMAEGKIDATSLPLPDTVTPDNTVGAGVGRKSCNTCSGSFTASEYRAHFKSDWHRYNLNLKMEGVKCVSEDEFKSCDVDSFF